uniref:Ion_trans_2 domain-containing protein n=1 Tax=Macrostomum lignano TaxID=282301 RepID=A0A1I8H048_9PLAT
RKKRKRSERSESSSGAPAPRLCDCGAGPARAPRLCADWAPGCCSAHRTRSRPLLALPFLSMASFAIYATVAAALDGLVEYCTSLTRWPLISVDLGLNCFFGVHFMLRCLAAQDKLAFWLEFQSIIDYCTVPSTFFYWAPVSATTGWACGSCAGLRLLVLPDLLLHLGLAPATASACCSCFTIFVGVWLIGAGVFHVLENFGDVHRHFDKDFHFFPRNATTGLQTKHISGKYDCMSHSSTQSSNCFVVNIWPLLADGWSQFLLQQSGTVGSIENCSDWHFQVFTRLLAIFCQQVLNACHCRLISRGLRPPRAVVVFNRANWQRRLISRTNSRVDTAAAAVNIGFGDSLYFTIVTMSTVGYGDISPRTDSGRVFACLYILFALSVFASHIPEMAQMLTSRSPYAGSYRKETGRPHLVVCGAVCQNAMESFLADLLHKDRKQATARNLQVVCIGQFIPDLEFQGLLKRHFRKLAFFEGTIMSPNDCARVALDSAEAAVVLANKYAEDPDEEDSTNIMRAIAIKNAAPGQRCIVQLLRQRNRAGLLSIPSWDWRLGDECVCVSELTLGLLAQSCTAPGFSTLMANLLAVRSMPSEARQLGDSVWEADYRRGSCYEIYSVRLGVGLQSVEFAEAAAACYASESVILLALEEPEDEAAAAAAQTRHHRKQRRLLLNPSLRQDGQSGSACVIQPGCRGLFLADSYDEARRAAELALSPSRICPIAHQAAGLGMEAAEAKTLTAVEEEELFDSTGAWHWCPARSFQEALQLPKLRGHHILCVVAAGRDTAASGLGLASFLRPLRSSSLRRRELAPVVLVGGAAYLRREWPALRHFPDVFALPGRPMSRAVLRRAGLNACDTCVIVGARSRGATKWRDPIDPYLMDREVVLCTLNIRAMDADRVAAADAAAPTAPTPVITEIFVDKNVQFLDQEDDDSPADEMHNSQPFVCGSAFAASALDSLLSTVYYNPSAMSLVRALVTGGVESPSQPAAEDDRCEGLDDDDDVNLESGAIDDDGQQAKSTTSVPDRWRRSRMARLPLTDRRLAQYIASGSEGGTFGRLFLGALRSQGILCLGVARFRDAYRRCAGSSSCRRFVIACPSANFRLLPTDAVYCLVPFPVELKPQ